MPIFLWIYLENRTSGQFPLDVSCKVNSMASPALTSRFAWNHFFRAFRPGYHSCNHLLKKWRTRYCIRRHLLRGWSQFRHMRSERIDLLFVRGEDGSVSVGHRSPDLPIDTSVVNEFRRLRSNYCRPKFFICDVRITQGSLYRRFTHCFMDTSEMRSQWPVFNAYTWCFMWRRGMLDFPELLQRHVNLLD